MPDLVEESVTVAGRELHLLRPRDPEALIDEGAFAQDEFLPYWAELWPSAHALTEVLCARELHGVRVLELGCGLGLPSLAAAALGAQVTATDWALARPGSAMSASPPAATRLSSAADSHGALRAS